VRDELGRDEVLEDDLVLFEGLDELLGRFKESAGWVGLREILVQEKRWFMKCERKKIGSRKYGKD
jgi:hypothetical protein